MRFTLKVLKAKNDNGNWMYAPKSGAYILEAARKILGRDIVDQCQWKVHESVQADADADENLAANGDSGPAEGSYKIEALLPNSKYGKLPLYVMIRYCSFLKIFLRSTCNQQCWSVYIGRLQTSFLHQRYLQKDR